MPAFRVQLDAAKTNRSLADAAAAPVRGRKQTADPVLKFWRWTIKSTVHEAKRTKHGLPTDGAILARWWIEEHKPKQEDRVEWERSFECACLWLGDDPAAERKRLLAEIDRQLLERFQEYARTYAYQRRAAVLTCAGVMTAIGKQTELPLVSEADYDDIAGVEHGDPPAVTVKMALMAA